MTNIPEDSMLRRHYLTEQRYKKGDVSVQTVDSITTVMVDEPEQYAAPFWSNQVLIPLVAFTFIMALVFI